MSFQAHLDVFTNGEGFTVAPIENGYANPQKRVFVAGPFKTLTGDQITALVKLAYRTSDDFETATFYDGARWAEEEIRHPILVHTPEG